MKMRMLNVDRSISLQSTPSARTFLAPPADAAMLGIVTTGLLAHQTRLLSGAARPIGLPNTHNPQPECTRRTALISFCTAAMVASPASCLIGLGSTASARVDGIPLYAPAAGTFGNPGLPDEGFETLLPRVEGFASNAAAAVDAARNAEWDRIREVLAAVPVKYQSTNLGKYAAILGDDAYTALSLKSEYLSGIQALSSAVGPASAGNQKEAERAIKAAELMQSSLQSLLELVPPTVVAQVRAREKALAKALAREEKEAREKAEAERLAAQAREAMVGGQPMLLDEDDQMGA